jgi:hypothetical protein
MNIKPKYRHGIALKSGKYDIEVTRSGYESKRGWVEIKNADLYNMIISSETSFEVKFLNCDNFDSDILN